MIDLKITEEDLEVLRDYRHKDYLMLNQLLISNSEIDVALLSNTEIKNEKVLSYEKESVKKSLEELEKLYTAMLKLSMNINSSGKWTYSYVTNLNEVQRLKNEIYIDYFLSATFNEIAIKQASSSEDSNVAIIRFEMDNTVPIIYVDEALKTKSEAPEILISPFTKIKDFSDETFKCDNGKEIKICNIKLEKQDIQEITEEERKSIYEYILSSSDVVNQKLKECVQYEKENKENYENIRKLEQLLAKLKLEIQKKIEFKDYPEIEREADNKDIERITSELEEYKDSAANIFEEKKMAIDFITKWKKNVIAYVMAEFRELEIKFDVESKVAKENYEAKVKKLEEEAKEKHERLKEESIEEIAKTVSKECDENIVTVKRLIQDIKNLILKQQNHAKIADSMGATYSALNNGFEMKKAAEELLEKVEAIKLKAKELCDNEDRDLLSDKLISISKINLQISTLMNYLNNPKSAVGRTKITRFEEMAIIEENELKRGIAERIMNVRGEAELKKLKDDLEILEEKGAFKRFIGFFTGSNKLDEIKEEQIEIRQKAIRKTLSQKMSLVYNYSIHELVAEIQMFLEDNEDDDLVEEDIYILQNMENELRRNFIISDSKVRDIIYQRENKNLPVEVKKITKRELIEIETYRFLNKYGYDKPNSEKNEKYQDTMQNEIARIVDYIKSSNVLN